MQPDGSFVERQDAGGKETRNCQEIFIELAQKRLSAATKHRQSKLRLRLLNHFHRRLQINTGQA
jgi:hypothetical protein